LLRNSGQYAVKKLSKHISVHSEEVFVTTRILSVEFLQQLLSMTFDADADTSPLQLLRSTECDEKPLRFLYYNTLRMT